MNSSFKGNWNNPATPRDSSRKTVVSLFNNWDGRSCRWKLAREDKGGVLSDLDLSQSVWGWLLQFLASPVLPCSPTPPLPFDLHPLEQLSVSVLSLITLRFPPDLRSLALQSTNSGTKYDVSPCIQLPVPRLGKLISLDDDKWSAPHFATHLPL